MAGFTHKLRTYASWSWSLGLGLVAVDFLSLSFLQWRISSAYFAFFLSLFFVVWAEKREFGTRVFLYRLHDVVIYTPWKFMLLYFLWVSLFSLLENALTSVVFSLNGWATLFAVGVAAQFIFCERARDKIILLPGRLRVAFLVYACTTLFLLVNLLLHLFWATIPLPMLVHEEGNLFLYFLMGMPFLGWDFSKNGRRLLPRALSLAVMIVGGAAILLLGNLSQKVALLLAGGGLLAVYFLKAIRYRRALLLGGAIGLGCLSLSVLLSMALQQFPAALALRAARSVLETRVAESMQLAFLALEHSHFMGLGVGVTEITGLWARILGEAGVVGFLLVAAFFLNLLWDLYWVRRSSRVVVSNVAIISLLVFLFLLGHYVHNPYTAFVWVWCSLWSIFSSTARKRAY